MKILYVDLIFQSFDISSYCLDKLMYYFQRMHSIYLEQLLKIKAVETLADNQNKIMYNKKSPFPKQQGWSLPLMVLMSVFLQWNILSISEHQQNAKCV